MPKVKKGKSCKNKREEEKRRQRLKRNKRLNQPIVVDRPIVADQERPYIKYNLNLSNKEKIAGKKFNEVMTKIEWNECTNCNIRFPDLNMDPGEVPPELEGLTYIEQMMIARVHPVISLYKIRGAQYAFSGHVINFNQNIQEYINKLPIHPKDLPSTIIFKKNTNNGMTEFKVRSQKILKALVWLKDNNMYYRDIIIDTELIKELPLDGMVDTLIPSVTDDDTTIDRHNLAHDEEGIDTHNIMSSCGIDQDAKVKEELELEYPGVEKKAINEFEADGYITKAFPCLFPRGAGDYKQGRLQTVSRDLYFRHLMQYKDGRFSKDPRFVYFAMNTTMRHCALSQSNLFFKDECINKDISMEELKEKISNDKSLLSKVMVYTGRLRSSSAFWKNRCGELTAMIEQIGRPTMFFTLSAADYYWPELYKLLAPEKPYETLTASEKRRLMHENPVVVSYFFQKRVEEFIKLVIIPCFGVVEYYYRIEWQSRGSPHIHGVFWMKQAPNVDIEKCCNNDMERIVQFFDMFIAAINTNIIGTSEIHPSAQLFCNINEEEYEIDLNNLINTLQRHTQCGDHCLRNKNGKWVCRYKFPHEEQDKSCITTDEGFYQYIPARNDPYVQRYNKLLLQVWRANMDMNPILDTNAVVNYLTKYAMKGEVASKKYIQLINELNKNVSNEDTVKRIISRMIVTAVSERDYSIQETVHVLMNWPLYASSRRFVIINTYEKQWNKVKKNDSVEQYNSCINRYIHRPTSFENVSLSDFYKNWSYSRNQYTKNKIPKIAITYPKYRLKEMVDNELFYKQQCILNIPFRGKYDSLLNLLEEYEEKSWETLATKYDIHTNSLDMNDCDGNEYDGTEKQFGELVDLDEEDKHVSIFEKLSAAHVSQEEDILGKRNIDIFNDWTSDRKENPTYDEINQLLQTYKFSPKNSVTDDDESDKDIIMSEEQNRIMQKFHNHMAHWKSTNVKKVQPSNSLMIIQGRAGSGKSTVIKQIRREMITAFGASSIAIAAPSGCAAANVEGETLHSYFKVPIYHVDFQPLTSGSLKKAQDTNQHLKLVIIDEMSLMGCRLLYKVEQRCRELNPDVDKPFGGIHVYLFGDFNQLPPVGDASFFSQKTDNMMAAKGKLIFYSFNTYIELKSTHRQKDPRFIELLDRLADGKVTYEDYTLLCSRRESVLSVKEKSRFSNAIKLYAKNDTVRVNNIKYLTSMKTPVACIQAQDSVKCSVDKDDNAGLIRKLFVAKGCRVMLRSNLWVAGGLVNGSLGTVTGILYDDNMCPPDLPRYILVKFDKYKGPCLSNGSFPIVPIIRTWVGKGNQTCTRKQFPLTLAYASTIHKSQGLTLPVAVIDIQDKDFAAGLSYVGYSRVRDLKDIMIPSAYDYSRLHKIGMTRMAKMKNEFMTYLRTLNEENTMQCR